MICPYIQSFALTEHVNVLDIEKNFIKKTFTATVWKSKECEKENCAVWRDGECCYNSKK